MGSNDTVIRKIKILRELNNFTQEYIAAQLGISQNAYSMLEKGLTKMTLERMDEIAEFYKVTALDLLSEESSISLNSNEVWWKNSNFPPAVSPMEKLLYEKTIDGLEQNVAKLYSLIEQLSKRSDASTPA